MANTTAPVVAVLDTTTGALQGLQVMGSPTILSAGGGGGSSTFVTLTDAVTADIATVNTSVAAVKTTANSAASTASTANTLAGTANTTANTAVAALSVQALNSQSGSTYTAVLSDAGQNIDMTSSSPNQVTIPINTFPLNTLLTITMAGTGITTLVPASGVTFVKPATGSYSISEQYRSALAYQTSLNTWRVVAG